MTRCLRITSIVGALTVLAAAGCGTDSPAKKVVMSGAVSYEGKPIDDGTITFTCLENVKGAPSAEGKIQNGHYKLADVIPGKNSVSIKVIPKKAALKGPEDIEKRPDPGKMVGKMDKNMSPEDAQKAMGFGSAMNQIPDDAVGNNATITVPENGGTRDFPLTKPAGKN